MKQYMTSQRKTLIAFLRAYPDKQFSAKEIADNIKDTGISLSAVYRNLSVLEENGEVVSVLREGCRDRYYRCMLSDGCKDCIHLTCTKCGKTTHLSRLAADELADVAAEQNSFKIEKAKTAIYGVCKNCQ